MSDPRVLLLGRVGCHLCDDARVVVSDVCARLDTTWAECDIDEDGVDDLRERYTDAVPVVLVDGEEHARYRVDAGRLARALR